MRKFCFVLATLVFLSACAGGSARNKGGGNSMVRVACDKSFAPFTYLDSAGQPAGMIVDIWNLWVQKTGRTVRLVFSDWNGTIKNLSNGGADVHSGLFMDDSRAKWMDFSIPFYRSEIAVFVPVSQEGVKTFPDLAGKKAGAIKGSAPLEFLMKGAPNALAIAYSDYPAMIEDALSGKIQAFADEAVGAWTVLNQMGQAEKFSVLPGGLAPREFHAAVRKGNDRLLQVVNQGLSLITPQEMAAIESRWIPVNARQFNQKKQ